MTRIFLIGYMGSGKSWFGKRIAKRLGVGFLDLDAVIEAKYRKSVSELFSQFGESQFRTIEHNVLLEIADFEDVVIATGGGTPCFFNNMETMSEKGVTVYIRLAAAKLATRLTRAQCEKRPLLAGKSPIELKEFIEKTLAEREKFYLQAKIVIDGNDSEGEIIEKLEMKMKTLNQYLLLK